MDTIYQTQCQSGTHEAQSVQWPPDMSDLILTLSSVPMARIYCSTIYLFLVILTENGMHKGVFLLVHFFKELVPFQG